MIYGALPPETRRQQAQLFNAEGNRYSVLVASDAVGMGLNLNIGRVVFHSLYKRHGRSTDWSVLWLGFVREEEQGGRGDVAAEQELDRQRRLVGRGRPTDAGPALIPFRHACTGRCSHPSHAGDRQLVPVPVPMVKQIAGRAGRRNSRYPVGCVTYRERTDGEILVHALNVRRLVWKAAAGWRDGVGDFPHQVGCIPEPEGLWQGGAATLGASIHATRTGAAPHGRTHSPQHARLIPPGPHHARRR